MTDFNTTDDYFNYVEKHPECKIIVYGAGQESKRKYKFIGHIDYFCDQKAKTIGRINNIPCLLPEELLHIDGKMIILVCIRNEEIANQVCESLDSIRPDAEIFYFFRNTSFTEFDYSPYQRQLNLKECLRIRIICLDESWIIGKFARKLEEELIRLGQEVDVADEEDPLADVNHYVFYGDLARIYKNCHTVRTSMITHIDCQTKKELIKFQAENGVFCICMSSEMVNRLSAWGIARDRLCYVNPAQDGEIEPKKIVLGITNKCHHDFRKKDDLILEVCRRLDSCFFKLKIMGSGWDQIVEQIRELGFEVDYYAEFNREIYKELMPSLDYWIYYGFDEGAMGYLDALAAGVKTICTPQGYHLDTKSGLTYPCSTVEDFIKVLKRIQEEKKEIISAVKDWTWENYAKKHLEIWQYLTGTKSLKDLFLHQGEYMDGIFSMLLLNIREEV